MNNAERARWGRRAGLVGILCNALLCAGKFAAGAMSGSMSIMADAVNNLSDAASSAVSLAGFWLSEKRPDREHPYGHARYEYLSGLVVAIFEIVIGAQLLRDGIGRILRPAQVELTAASVAVLCVSIAVKLGLALLNHALGRRLGSGALEATAADSRNDCITTAAVLAAAVLSHRTGLPLDGPMTALVAVFILLSGAELVRDEMNPLLGTAPSPEFAESIREKILSYPGVLSTHDLIVHDYGYGRKFATAHVEMAAEQDVLRSHAVIDDMEYDFLHNDGIHLLVHFDPIVTDRSAPGDARQELEALVKLADERLSVHDLRLVPCGDHTKAYFDVALPRESGMDQETLRREICRFVRRRHPDYLCVITMDDSFAAIPPEAEEYTEPTGSAEE